MPNVLEDQGPQRVSELIDKDTRTWKLANIEQWTSEGVQQAIESIPLGVFGREDQRTWPYTKNGKYTVKSGYYALKTAVPRQSQQEIDPGGTVYRIQRAVFEFVNLENKQQSSSIQTDTLEMQKLWQKPPDDWLKINSDGSFCPKSKAAGIGIVVRDSIGRVLDAISAKVKASDVLTVEALALREAVKLAVAKGFHKVCFESDSSILVNDVNNNDCGSQTWKISAVIRDIQILVNSIENAEVKLISRTANLAADWFAKQSRQRMSYVDWRQHPPSSLVKIWSFDGVPAPH
ncbi:hypothetical protein COLO4_27602 [Corchorus olitorius]|uniref:RNase H type-1 domain-containing protein n=1 Tax=Corchorus olitorius TaxID=93759 RepID=A0A1R3HQ08_9ROSI|nr:hypothetical protein COLO4_27602 [Corchorus olitorius]